MAKKVGPTSGRSVTNRFVRAMDLFYDLCDELLAKAPDSPGHPSGPGYFRQILAQAAATNNGDLFSFALQMYLVGAGLRAPKGVFKMVFPPSRAGRRPKLEDQCLVWLTYHELDEPSFGALARRLYPSDYNRDQKKTTDRVRQLYRSCEERLQNPAFRQIAPGVYLGPKSQGEKI
jgi:hypothetical protein